MILFWLKFLSDEHHILKVKDDKKKLNLICLTMKLILIITSFQDLNILFLENKKCMHLIIVCIQNFIHLNNSNPHLLFSNGISDLFAETENNILQIAINIIENCHEEFINTFYKNNVHFLLYNFL